MWVHQSVYLSNCKAWSFEINTKIRRRKVTETGIMWLNYGSTWKLAQVLSIHMPVLCKYCRAAEFVLMWLDPSLILRRSLLQCSNINGNIKVTILIWQIPDFKIPSQSLLPILRILEIYFFNWSYLQIAVNNSLLYWKDF